MNRIRKQVICLLLSMVLLLSMLPVSAEGPIASGTCGTNISWVITESGTLLISGDGAMPDYSTRTGAPWSDYYASIQSVDVGSGVTGIGNWAFASCNRLTVATIANTVKRIGMHAFSGCYNLKDADIPQSVTEIGAYAFYNCRALTAVVIPEGVTTIHPATFNTCTSLTSVTLPGSLQEILGQGTYGGNQVKLGAFAYCSNLTSVTIPDGVTKIGYMAFNSCKKLTSITIPASVKSIGGMAFGYTQCTINFLGSAPTMESNCFDNANIEAYYPCGNTTWQKNAENDFGGTTNWNVSHTMEESVTSQAATCTKDAVVTGTCLSCGKTETATLFGTAMGHNYVNDVCTRCSDAKLILSEKWGKLTYQLDTTGTATISGTGPMDDEDFMEGSGYGTLWWWKNCEEQITRVVIEEGVTRIGNMAFYHCRNLKSVSIPDSVTSIGKLAFAECINLPYVIIPSGVTKIEGSAFYNCTNLTAVAFLGSAPAIDQSAFSKTNLTAYHPCDDETWTDDVRQNNKGTITWVGHLYRDYAPHQAATCTDNGVVTGTCGTCGVTGQVALPDTTLPHNLDQNGLCKTCGGTSDITVTMKRTPFSEGCVYIEIYADDTLLKKVGLADFEDDVTDTVPCVPGKTYTFQWSGSSNDTICEFEIITQDEILLSDKSTGYCDGDVVYTLENPHFHQYEAVITAPDCKATGSVTHTCTTCGHSYNTTVPTVGHRYENGLCVGCGKGELPVSGSCGTSVNWYLDTMGNLTISGIGAMKDYAIGEDGTTPNTPWYQYRSLISKVVIVPGVTTIGEYAFHGCQNLSSVTISETVTTIGKLAFYNCTGLTDVTIPGNVTTIGSAAFRRCSGLKNVTLSEGVTTIGKIAFFDCTGLEEVTIPGSITSVGEYAFGNCTGLTSITFSGTAPAIDGTGFKMVTATVSYPCNDSTWTADRLQGYGGTLTWEKVHRYAEGQCVACGKWEHSCGENVYWTVDELGTLTISGTGPMENFNSNKLPPWTEQQETIRAIVIEEGVTTIGDYAFGDCYCLSSVTIPGTVTHLGVGAFQNCPTLNALLFEGDVPTIHEQCFEGVKATGYYPCDNETWTSLPSDTITWKAHHRFVDGVCTVCNQTTPIIDSGRCGYNLWWQLDDSGTLIITGTGAMYSYEYHYDEDDPLGDMMADIPDWHSYKDIIKAIEIRDGVTSIGEDAFLRCEAVETITIAKTVTKIAEPAFYCLNLKQVFMEGNAPTIKSNSFYIGYNVMSAVLSYYEDCVGYDISAWSEFTHTTRHPGTVVITTPATCTRAGTREIQCTYCKETIQETYSPGHQYISGLCVVCGEAELMASGSWWRLYQNGTLFIDQQGAMPDYTRTADVPWYNYRTRVTKVVIGKDTSSIGAYCFRDCTGLTDVFVLGTVKTIGKAAFYGCTGLTDVTIPQGVKTVGSYAFYNCTGLTDVEIAEGITGISAYAFAYCSKLANITLPQSLRIIYENAFQNCSKLASVDIPKSVSNIGANAFASCARLATVIFRGTAVIFGEKCFDGVKAVAYSYCADATWTSTARSDAGGSMTWGKLHSGDEKGYCTNCGQSPQLIINLLEAYTSPSEDAVVTVYADGAPVITATGATQSAVTTVPYDPGKTYTFHCSNPNPLLCSAVVLFNDEVLVSKSGSELTHDQIFYTLKPRCTHQYAAVITPPTCTEEGFTTYTCAHCHHSYVTNAVPETDHSYTDGVCTVCGMTQTVDSGTCGYSLQWRLDVMDTLYISGKGSMYDFAVDYYQDGSKAPWDQYRLQITKVVIEEGVTSVGELAFYGCRNLTDVIIPESMIRLCKQAFYDCIGLTEITIPKGVRYIENAVFRHCVNLTDVIICEGVTEIGDIMFYDCTGLQEISLPASITTIGEYAFGNCSALQKVTFRGPAPTMNSLSFKSTTATICYPCTEESWTAETKQDYSGTLTWKADHQYEDDTCTLCGQDRSTILPGDLNGDGNRTIVDVARLYAHVQGSNSLDDTSLPLADVNGDGTVDIGDTARLYAHVKGTSPLQIG